MKRRFPGGLCNVALVSGGIACSAAAAGQPGPLNYGVSQPVPPATAAVQRTQADASSCARLLQEAFGPFRNEDYQAALELIDHGLTTCPGNPDLNEYRGLVLFALGNYQEASASLHKALAVRHGWKWSTTGRLYGSVTSYTTHLRSLEAFTRKHPDDGGARFLLAHHYLANGYPGAAIRELEMVVRLEPDDRTAAILLRTTADSQLSAGQLRDAGAFTR